MAILALLLLYSGLVEPNWVQVSNVEVQISGLPAQFDGFRIVQLSDLHLSGPREALPPLYRRVARTANRLSPDVIAVTGDLMSIPAGAPLAHDFLSSLRAKHGIYLVWGNWDQAFISPGDAIEKDFGSLGVKVLDDEAEVVSLGGARVWFLGVLFSKVPAGHSALAFQDALKKGYKGEVVVLLSHSPGVWSEAVKAGADLILSGHTHGGQVWLPIWTRFQWSRYPYPRLYRGLGDLGSSKIYINRGIGTSWVPFRFLSRPEVSVIVLRAAA